MTVDRRLVACYYTMSTLVSHGDEHDPGTWRARVRVLIDRALDTVGEHDLDAVLQRIVVGAAEVSGARYAALGVYDRAGAIVSFVHHGIDAGTVAQLGEFPAGRGLLGRVIVADAPLRLDDLTSDPRSCGFPPGHPEMRTFLGAPIGRGGRRYGNLYLTEKAGDVPFDAEDEGLVMVLAAFAAAAIESVDLVEAERARADEIVRRVEAEDTGRARRELLAAVISAQEAERARVSRDLHDDIGQALTSVLLGLRLIEDDGSGSGTAADSRGHVEDLRELVADALRRTRQLAFDLRPTVLDDVGLAPALTRLVADVSERSGLIVDAVVDTRPDQAEVSADVATVVYRVVQESLTNVVRHSHAHGASVAVTSAAGHLRAVIEDDGVGFDPSTPATGHLGLQGMRERAELIGGTVQILSSAGAGTTIVLEVPVG